MAQTYTHLIAQRVRNNGDMCNAPREGIVTDIKVDRFGTWAVILWDEDEAIGWDRYGSAVVVNEAVSVIAAHSIKSANSINTRFKLLA